MARIGEMMGKLAYAVVVGGVANGSATVRGA